MTRALVLFLILLAKSAADQNGTKKFNFDFHQDDYDIEVERMELVRYNKVYVKFFQVKTFKFNRTATAFNITFHSNVDVGDNLEIVAQAYKFLSNEYREFPMRFQYNYCVAVAKSLFGYNNQAKCGNFTGCQIVKGRTYHTCNWMLDQSRFPPYLPIGRYMVELQHLYQEREIVVTRFYLEITRSILRNFKF